MIDWELVAQKLRDLYWIEAGDPDGQKKDWDALPKSSKEGWCIIAQNFAHLAQAVEPLD